MRDDQNNSHVTPSNADFTPAQRGASVQSPECTGAFGAQKHGVECPTSGHIWLAFTPAYTNQRGAQTQRLGAHAFRADRPRSLCGYVERVKAGSLAGTDARRCVWCERVIDGKSMDRSVHHG